MSSSENSSDASDSEDDLLDLKVMQLQRENQRNLALTACMLTDYFSTYYDKNEPRSSQFPRYAWVMQTLNTPGESYKMFRITTPLFYTLHDVLVSNYGLRSTIHMSSMESLAIFLLTCGHGWSNGAVNNKFTHSGETISRKFFEVLNSMVGMAKDYIQPKDPNFHEVHSRITSDQRMWPFFKDCIGAIDGTHINCTPPPKDFLRFMGRSGKSTQNVMGVVDFDMRFTYTSIGQLDSMHDTSVLYHAIESDHDIFPHPPLGKYYVVDAGYPNRPGYLAPYKGQRYHVPDWRRGPAPSGEQELFNHLHSSLRNVVERTFGVWKMKWRILLKMPSYPMAKQKMIVAATMCLHNFIRENNALDEDFQMCDRDPDYVPTIPTRYRRHIPQNGSDASTSHPNDRDMDKFRDDMARAISQSR